MIWCNDHHGRAGADAYLATSLGAPSARWWLPIPTLAAAATAQIETMSKFPPGIASGYWAKFWANFGEKSRFAAPGPTSGQAFWNDFCCEGLFVLRS